MMSAKSEVDEGSKQAPQDGEKMVDVHRRNKEQLQQIAMLNGRILELQTIVESKEMEPDFIRIRGKTDMEKRKDRELEKLQSENSELRVKATRLQITLKDSAEKYGRAYEECTRNMQLYDDVVDERDDALKKLETFRTCKAAHETRFVQLSKAYHMVKDERDAMKTRALQAEETLALRTQEIADAKIIKLEKDISAIAALNEAAYNRCTKQRQLAKKYKAQSEAEAMRASESECALISVAEERDDLQKKLKTAEKHLEDSKQAEADAQEFAFRKGKELIEARNLLDGLHDYALTSLEGIVEKSMKEGAERKEREMNEANDKLKKRMDKSVEELGVSRAAEAAAKEDAKKKEQELSKITNELQKLKESSMTALNEITAQLSTAKADVQQKARQLKDAKDELQRLQHSSLETLTETLLAENAEAAAKEKALIEAKNELKQLKATLEKELGEIRAPESAANAKAIAKEKSLIEANEEIKRLKATSEKELGDSKAAEVTAKEEAAQREKELNETKEKLQMTMDSSERALAESREDMEKLEAKVKSAEKKLEESKAAMVNLEAKVKSAEKKFEECKAAEAAAKVDTARKGQELLKAIENLESNVKSAEEKLRGCRAAETAAKETAARKDRELKEANEMLRNLKESSKKDLEAIRAAEATAKAEAARPERALTEAKEKSAKNEEMLEQKLAQKDEELCQMIAEVAKLRSWRKQMQDSIAQVPAPIPPMSFQSDSESRPVAAETPYAAMPHGGDEPAIKRVRMDDGMANDGKPTATPSLETPEELMNDGVEENNIVPDEQLDQGQLDGFKPKGGGPVKKERRPRSKGKGKGRNVQYCSKEQLFDKIVSISASLHHEPVSQEELAAMTALQRSELHMKAPKEALSAIEVEKMKSKLRNALSYYNSKMNKETGDAVVRILRPEDEPIRLAAAEALGFISCGGEKTQQEYEEQLLCGFRVLSPNVKLEILRSQTDVQRAELFSCLMAGRDFLEINNLQFAISRISTTLEQEYWKKELVATVRTDARSSHPVPSSQ